MSNPKDESFPDQSRSLTAENKWAAPQIADKPFTEEVRRLLESKGLVFTPEQLQRFAEHNLVLGFTSAKG